MGRIEQIIDGVSQLVSPPDVAARIRAVLDDPRSTVERIAAAVSQDPALAACLLKVANSAFFGASQRVDSLQKAVAVLGTDQTLHLSLALSVAHLFEGIPNELVSVRSFWHHSVLCAVCARLLSAECQGCRPGVAFVGGLLHDIGKLVVFRREPKRSRLALQQAAADPVSHPLYACERESLGFDHAAVGGALARRWRLPDNLVECIEFHHEPERALAAPLEVSVVHIANALGHVVERGTGDLSAVAPVHAAAWTRTHLSEGVVDRIVPAAQTMAKEVESMFKLGELR